MKAKLLYIFCLFIILVPPLWAQASCILKGKWQSNEETTLREMAKNKNLTEKQVEKGILNTGEQIAEPDRENYAGLHKILYKLESQIAGRLA